MLGGWGEFGVQIVDDFLLGGAGWVVVKAPGYFGMFADEDGYDIGEIRPAAAG